jgi:mucin-19
MKRFTIALATVFSLGATIWAANGALSGAGTETSPFLLEDYADLKAIGAGNYLLSSHYRLGTDINAAASHTENCVSGVCAGFAPIGNMAAPFTGTFNGAGFVIRGLYIVADTAGLFGATSMDASVHSLGLENAQVKGTTFVGAIAGFHKGQIFRSYVAGGTVQGSQYVGGLAGYLQGQISECYTATAVTARNYAGGLAGYSSDGSLRDVYATGSVSSHSDAGGIVGLASRTAVVRAFASGPVLGMSDAGGLIGDSYNSTTVDSSYWSQDRDSLGQQLTSAQMRDAASFVGWDFNAVWTITAGASYPRLANLHNAPSTFATAAPTHATSPTANGYYASQPMAALVARWTGLRRPNAAHDSLYAYYQIGYPANATDTLWGGIAPAAAPMDTIAIATYDDLKRIGVNAAYPLEATYELTADIDASASAQENCVGSICAGFIPIGAASYFSGTLLGHGHRIMNLHIQRDTSSYVGLFAVLASSARVDSLQLTGLTVYGKSLVGGLASINYGIIKASRVQGAVTGFSSSIGGLVGNNVGTLDSCGFQGSVVGGETTGGLAGFNKGSIRRSSALGSVSASSSRTGGLVGSNYSTATINTSYAAVSVKGANYTGGLVGGNSGTVDTSYALGSVTGIYATGALMGSNSGTIRQSFAAGRVKAYYGTGNSIGSNSGILLSSYWIDLYGSPENMTAAAAYDGWDFSTSSPWKIDEGHRFPALRALDNPPTAFPDRTSLLPDTSAAINFPIMPLLLANDRDPDDATAHLAIRWTDSTQGIRVYQAGTVSGTDTLWGGEAVLRENQIEIANYTDLKKIGVDAAYGLYRDYRLTANIDASASATENCVGKVCAGFAPIGKRNAPFTGTFNGVGHVIHDLVIQRSSADSIGFFGFASGASIDSLALENLYVRGRYRIGGLVGVGLTTKVRHSRVQGTVLGSAYVGGLAGDLTSSSIEACYTSVRIQGDDYLGGLAGYASGTTLRDCYTNGALRGNSTGGGLVGYASSSTAQRCYVTGPVQMNEKAGALAGYGSLNNTATYWDKEATHFNSLASDSIYGFKTAAMRTAASFAGWDFAKVWTIDEGKSYPTLRGQDNAPFAFGAPTAMLDPATGYYGGTGILTARWTLHTTLNATRDSVYKTFQIGVIRGSADTLWGGFAQHATPTISINIASYADLKKIGLDENYPLWATYNLTNDINAGLSYREDCSTSSGKTYCDGFVPIGAFPGVFHGHGHTIDSLNIEHQNDSYQGLFSKVDNGIVDSLHITHAKIVGSERTGVLTGYNSGTIRHCSASGIIYGWHYVGGLLGHNDGTIDSSHANVWIKSAADSVGGLAGYNGRNGVIRYSSAQGDIYAGRYAGGLVGVNERGSISYSFATGTAQAWIHTAGGLAAFNNGVISQSYAIGPAISEGDNVGGLVGSLSGGTVGNSYATGPVTGQNNVGGLFGTMAHATVNNSYSTGWVNAALTASAHGGLSGANYNPAQLASSYWNQESSGQDSTPNLASSHGLSTAQMTHAQNFVGWDFATIWEIAEGSSYPALRGLDDLPFTFPAQADIVPASPTPHGYAMETPTATLVARWTGGRSVNQSRDSLFSEYQVGAQLANNDIVWGSRANLATPLGTIAIASFADLVKIGKSTAYPLDANYRLVADIDAARSTRFAPIGPTDSTAFTGSFHGNGHVIRNLYAYNSRQAGLFGYLRNALIDSLGMINAEVHGYQSTGILAGINDGGIITDCYTTGQALGYYSLGGLVGNNQGTIAHSYSTSDVTTQSVGAGGLVGNNSGVIRASYATGRVRTAENASVSYSLGGLVGDMEAGSVENSYATGPVQGNTYTGGLVGELGFLGQSSIHTSYAAGPLNTQATRVGGISATPYSSYIGSVDSSYWNRTITGVDTSYKLAQSNGLTTDAMRLRANFVGWNFATVWDINEGVSYPTLQSVNDAPFTFADTLTVAATFTAAQLLANDVDGDTPSAALAVRLDSTGGLSLAAGKFTLPTTSQAGDTLRFWYRAGTVNGPDTLWGNSCLSMVIAGPSAIKEPTHSVNNATVLASLRMEGNRLLLKLDLPRESQTEMQLLAPDGTQLAPTQSAIYAAGAQEIPFSLHALPSGTFIAAVRVDGKIIVHQTLHK